MIAIKICGLTRNEDIEYCNEYLPDYAGFVFAPGRRQLTLNKAMSLIAQLDSAIKTVGVFVNDAPQRILETVRHCGLYAVQLHGIEEQSFIDNLRALFIKNNLMTEIWKALRIKDTNSIKEIDSFICDRILLDAWSVKAYGGTGETFDWKLTDSIMDRNRIILAGGLNPDNAALAIKIVKPFGVDVSSGVETEGCKDAEKIRSFIEEARKAI